MKIWKSLFLGGAALGATAVYLRQQQQKQAELAALPLAQKYGSWAIVTGTARAEGIGFGFARHLAGRHLNLVLVDIMGDELELRAQALRQKYGVQVKTAVLDLGQPDAVTKLQTITADLEIGLLVCNHMVLDPNTPPILEMDLAMHRTMLNVNAGGYTMLIHTYGRQMVAQNRGGIVIVSSQAGLHSMPYTGAYSANKAYQLALGEALWYELKDTNVDVIVLAPGLTNSQGDNLDDYPQFMIMEVDEVIAETLDSLGKKHLVIPGALNKAIHLITTHFITRQQGLLINGRFMAQGLNKS